MRTTASRVFEGFVTSPLMMLYMILIASGSNYDFGFVLIEELLLADFLSLRIETDRFLIFVGDPISLASDINA